MNTNLINGKKRKKIKEKTVETKLEDESKHKKIKKQDFKSTENNVQPQVNKNNLEILSDIPFDILNEKVSSNTLRSIKNLGFYKMTKIQLRCIPPLLMGKDLVGAAKTGSGKTLAFLIPAVELISKLKFKRKHGTGILILSPTRELAIQIYGVLKTLMEYHTQTFGLVIGGVDRYKEADVLKGGVNILVATPGRLLDHLQSTSSFKYDKLKCLIIDEADRILNIGFEEAMKRILSFLPRTRQTILFSATQTEKTRTLTSMAFQNVPLYVGIDDEEESSTVSGLQQFFTICPTEKRFLFLYSFLKTVRKKKVMVFFSSCMSVSFHKKFFDHINVPIMCIHGKQKQSVRTSTFFEFCNKTSGILFCTDVAARGLDIPEVDWIIQYDPPDDEKEYIHRVGRTARGEGKQGQALLVLRPEEKEFVTQLKTAKVFLKEFHIPWEKVEDIQSEIEDILEKTYDLRMIGKEAFKTYIRAYSLRTLRNIFNINQIDLKAVALSFGFSEVPVVDLNVYIKKRDRNNKIKKFTT